MGRGGEEADQLLYGSWRFRGKGSDYPERAPGICGELQSAGVGQATQQFEIWEGSSWVTTEMESTTGRPAGNPEIKKRLEDYLDETLQGAFTTFLENGMAGTATFDVRESKISVDLYESYESEEEHPWKAETTPEVLEAMNEIGATSAEVSFDGYGDSGDVETVTFGYPDDVDEPSGHKVKEADEVLSNYVYEQLERRWEINSGSFGKASITPGQEADFDLTFRIEDSRLHRIKIDPETNECQRVPDEPGA